VEKKRGGGRGGGAGGGRGMGGREDISDRQLTQQIGSISGLEPQPAAHLGKYFLSSFPPTFNQPQAHWPPGELFPALYHPPPSTKQLQFIINLGNYFLSFSPTPTSHNPAAHLGKYFLCSIPPITTSHNPPATWLTISCLPYHHYNQSLAR
jgi:hypothetical protein